MKRVLNPRFCLISFITNILSYIIEFYHHRIRKAFYNITKFPGTLILVRHNLVVRNYKGNRTGKTNPFIFWYALFLIHF